MKAKSSKKDENPSDWKTLVHGFVGNVLEQLNENVTNRVRAWTKQMKRRAAGGILVVLGMTYFLTGLSDYANSIFGKNYPGFGYGIVGIIIVLIGYLMSRK